MGNSKGEWGRRGGATAGRTIGAPDGSTVTGPGRCGAVWGGAAGVPAPPRSEAGRTGPECVRLRAHRQTLAWPTLGTEAALNPRGAGGRPSEHMKTRHIILGLGLMGAALTAVVGAIGWGALDRVGAAVERSTVANNATQEATLGDMMHEGLRGDVYAALYHAQRGQADGVASAQKEAQAHGQAFVEIGRAHV